MDSTVILKLHQSYLASYRINALPMLKDLARDLVDAQADPAAINHIISKFSVVYIHNAAITNMLANNSVPSMTELKARQWHLYHALCEQLQKASIDACLRAYKYAISHNERHLENSQQFQNAFVCALFIEFCTQLIDDPIITADKGKAIDQIPNFEYTTTDLAKDMYRYLRKLQETEIEKFTSKLASLSPDDRDIVNDMKQNLMALSNSFSFELSKCRSQDRVYAVMFKYQIESAKLLSHYQIAHTSHVSWEPWIMNLLLAPLLIGLISYIMKAATGKFMFFDKPYLLEKTENNHDFNIKLAHANNFFVTGS